MKAVRVANLQAVAFSELVTIVRGDAAFSIRKTELADLMAVLKELGADNIATGPSEVTIEELGVTSPDMSHMTESGPSLRIAAVNRPAGKRRKGVWSEVRNFLRSCQRAQGRSSIVRHIRRANIVDGDVDGALTKVLDNRIKSGDVIITKSGRYRLTAS